MRGLVKRVVLGCLVMMFAEAHHWKPTGRREARKQLEAWHDACLSLQLHVFIHTPYTCMDISLSMLQHQEQTHELQNCRLDNCVRAFWE